MATVQLQKDLQIMENSVVMDFFGYISGAKIKNIVFTDVNMTYNGSQ